MTNQSLLSQKMDLL
jgi:hypothetical protein